MPLIKNYIVPIQLIIIALLVIGAYLKGSAHTELSWQLKVAQVQQQVIELERTSAELNSKLATKTAEKSKIIRIKGETIYQYIDKEVIKDREVIKFVETCPIPTKILELHNAAATNTPITPITENTP